MDDVLRPFWEPEPPEDQPQRDPEADPTSFEGWRHLQERPELAAAARGSGSSSRRSRGRSNQKPPTAAELREARRRTQVEAEQMGPRTSMVSARVSAEARAALNGDLERTLGELLEDVGRLAARGVPFESIQRVLRGWERTLEGHPRPPGQEANAA
jgi:hypothetical protein